MGTSVQFKHYSTDCRASPWPEPLPPSRTRGHVQDPATIREERLLTVLTIATPIREPGSTCRERRSNIG
jgi:hypothetical protein